MKAVNKGFTLIELMIVVAVIGVLAAIAIPQYQNYVAKGELGAALSAVSSLKTNVEDIVVNKGTFPKAADAATAKPFGVIQPGNGVITLAGDADAATGSIVFTFTKGKNSPKVSTGILNLTRDIDGKWECKITGVTDTDIYPKGCTAGSSPSA
ncbi:pilin [Plesiomonas shigelloides]|uniref:pilin n=1 Tax=Plesiomonas shigelloides TaxID=703 RepID=UPI0012626DC1|nr:pilin [Plesiomonas shigelloides]KAB7663510.1 prepilin-type N-terminal cleavage/methylation domain-containing protein [Plesiomonas shigelloides]